MSGIQSSNKIASVIYGEAQEIRNGNKIVSKGSKQNRIQLSDSNLTHIAGTTITQSQKDRINSIFGFFTRIFNKVITIKLDEKEVYVLVNRNSFYKRLNAIGLQTLAQNILKTGVMKEADLKSIQEHVPSSNKAQAAIPTEDELHLVESQNDLESAKTGEAEDRLPWEQALTVYICSAFIIKKVNSSEDSVEIILGVIQKAFDNKKLKKEDLELLIPQKREEVNTINDPCCQLVEKYIKNGNTIFEDEIVEIVEKIKLKREKLAHQAEIFASQKIKNKG